MAGMRVWLAASYRIKIEAIHSAFVVDECLVRGVLVSSTSSRCTWTKQEQLLDGVAGPPSVELGETVFAQRAGFVPDSYFTVADTTRNWHGSTTSTHQTPDSAPHDELNVRLILMIFCAKLPIPPTYMYNPSLQDQPDPPLVIGGTMQIVARHHVEKPVRRQVRRHMWDGRKQENW
ncbi:hypothetical protein BT67DRAFT_479469 [Trichocladium antarcticum]|uniref:Uncharacterized protein n=1 Tax=Trichocladium antarcticum TaxID=1450529 RepID=A0AAN6ZCX8_9PEZI|nr:hypothetical protein BT67DRAFT_479469 [Trichocladium antarcticum]